MADPLLVGTLMGVASGVAVLIFISALTLRRFDSVRRFDNARIHRAFEELHKSYERTERSLRQDIVATRRELEAAARSSRDESSTSARTLREEVTGSLRGFGDSLVRGLGEITSLQQKQTDVVAERLAGLTDNETRLAALRTTVEGSLAALIEANATWLDRVRDASVGGVDKAREEVTRTLGDFRDHLMTTLNTLASAEERQLGAVAGELRSLTEIVDTRLAGVRALLDDRLRHIQADNLDSLGHLRAEAMGNAKDLHHEMLTSMKALNDGVLAGIGVMGQNQQRQLEAFTAQLNKLTELNDRRMESVERTVQDRLLEIRTDHTRQLEAFTTQLSTVTELNDRRMESVERAVHDRLLEIRRDSTQQLEAFTTQLNTVTELNDRRMESVERTVQDRLLEIRADNTRQLEQVRATVDEKLQSTLERRLGENLRLVSERLEQVQRGLGEMQTLAAGVGDLKRVLTNVRARGAWGEIQLQTLLEEVLAPEQFERNVATRAGGAPVEFAIRLPGRSGTESEPVLLPIDAKFPLEGYQRLVEAQEGADPVEIENAAGQLELTMRARAAEISETYVNPPTTTEFAIMFLPSESLFAEVVRRRGLAERLQREFQVVIAGPTTLWSLLNSLQMGFRTLAIQKRSTEVWELLGQVKAQFDLYSGVLAKVKRRLDQAVNTVDEAEIRTRAIRRRLKSVPPPPVPAGIALPEVDNGGDTVEAPQTASP